MIRHAAAPRIVGLLAIALVAVVTLVPIGPALVIVVLVGVFGISRYVVSRHSSKTADARFDVARIAGCGLAPGVGVHAVRCGNRVLIVGSTPSTITLLESHPAGFADDGSRPRSPDSRADCSTADASRSAREGFAEIAKTLGTKTAARSTTRLTILFGVAMFGSYMVTPAARAETRSGESTVQRANLEGTHKPVGVRDAPPAAPGREADFAMAPLPDIQSAPAAGPGTLLWLAGLALLPFVVMGATSFVKISVVLSLLRNAIGTPQTPSDPVLAGIALSLTAFVMAPVAREMSASVNATSTDLQTATGALAALSKAAEPLRGFLRRNSRPDEIALFADIGGRSNQGAAVDPESFGVLLPSFVTTELREAFIIGFLVFVPFLVVDLVIANILMSMGMVMVSPTTVSLPFKILLFVLIDGWPMVMKGLALSYA